MIRPTDEIVLNVKDIVVEEAFYIEDDDVRQAKAIKIEYSAEDETVHIFFNYTLYNARSKEVARTLKLVYTGVIGHAMRGLYKSKYQVVDHSDSEPEER